MAHLATCYGLVIACLPSDLLLGGDDLIKAFYDADKFFRRDSADSLAEALNGKRANLADLHPRPLQKTAAQQPDGQGKPGRLRLDGDRHGDHGAGALVKDVMADDEDWTSPRLLSSPRRVEVGPEHVAPQYSGHDSRS